MLKINSFFEKKILYFAVFEFATLFKGKKNKNVDFSIEWHDFFSESCIGMYQNELKLSLMILILLFSLLIYSDIIAL